MLAAVRSENRLSFAFGVVATSVLAFTALAAIPDAQGVLPQKSAWVWKGNAVTRVPFRAPIDTPTLSHASDGTWWKAPATPLKRRDRQDAGGARV